MGKLRNSFNSVKDRVDGIRSRVETAKGSLGDFASEHPIITNTAVFGTIGLASGAIFVATAPLSVPMAFAAVGIGIAEGTGVGAGLSSGAVGISKAAKSIAARIRNTPEDSKLGKAFAKAARPATIIGRFIEMKQLNHAALIHQQHFQINMISLDQYASAVEAARDYATKHYPDKPEIIEDLARVHDKTLQEARSNKQPTDKAPPTLKR